jgi:hypothetical protein
MTGTVSPIVVTFDSVSNGFIFHGSVAGTISTITYATGTLAATFNLSGTNTGAVLQATGISAPTPAQIMAGVIAVTTNWATFANVTDPDLDTSTGNATKLAYAQWVATTNNQYAYVCADSDPTPTESTSAPASLGGLLAAANLSGTILMWNGFGANGTGYQNAFVSGMVASINTNARNGRITLAFKGQTGLTATVTTEIVAQNLAANGYNFYAAYATQTQQFINMQTGQISGQYDWADSYVNQIWLNAALQSSLLLLLMTIGAIPYNSQGYGLLRAACMGPIQAALFFGAIVPGVALSTNQIVAVNNATGTTQAANLLSTQGWYLQIVPATAQIRAARQSPQMTLWYCDGGAVQQITLSSALVQ